MDLLTKVKNTCGLPPATGFVDVRALPVIRSVAEGGAGQSVVWLVPLWLLCVVFWAAAYRDARKLLLDYEGGQSKAKVSVLSYLKVRDGAWVNGASLSHWHSSSAWLRVSVIVLL